MTKAHSKTLLRPFILVVFIAKVKAEILQKTSNTKSYNKTANDFNFGLREYYFLGLINHYVNLIEVNKCTLR